MFVQITSVFFFDKERFITNNFGMGSGWLTSPYTMHTGLFFFTIFFETDYHAKHRSRISFSCQFK
jgi:hypothetical protein